MPSFLVQTLYTTYIVIAYAPETNYTDQYKQIMEEIGLCSSLYRISLKIIMLLRIGFHLMANNINLLTKNGCRFTILLYYIIMTKKFYPVGCHLLSFFTP